MSLVLPLAALVITFYFAARTKSFDVSFALVLCACVVIGPLAWRAYLVWLALPLAIVVQHLRRFRSPAVYFLAAVVGLLLFGYPSPLAMIAGSFIQDGAISAPFIASLFTYIPLLAVCGVFALIVVLDRSVEPGRPSETQKQPPKLAAAVVENEVVHPAGLEPATF